MTKDPAGTNRIGRCSERYENPPRPRSFSSQRPGAASFSAAPYRSTVRRRDTERIRRTLRVALGPGHTKHAAALASPTRPPQVQGDDATEPAALGGAESGGEQAGDAERFVLGGQSGPAPIHGEVGYGQGLARPRVVVPGALPEVGLQPVQLFDEEIGGAIVSSWSRRITVMPAWWAMNDRLERYANEPVGPTRPGRDPAVRHGRARAGVGRRIAPVATRMSTRARVVASLTAS